MPKDKDCELREKIEALNLDTVRDKFYKKLSLIQKISTNTIRVMDEYRKFLYLVATHPHEVIVPWNQPLDDFWHEHILDTAKYREDCQNIFGRYLDHNPHLGKGTAKHTEASKNTGRLYASAFNKKNSGSSSGCHTSSYSPASSCGGSSNCSSPSCGSSCGSSCGGGGCGGGGD